LTVAPAIGGPAAEPIAVLGASTTVTIHRTASRPRTDAFVGIGSTKILVLSFPELVEG